MDSIRFERGSKADTTLPITKSFSCIGLDFTVQFVARESCS